MPRKVPWGPPTQFLLWIFAGSALTALVTVGGVALLIGDAANLQISSLAILAVVCFFISLMLTMTGYWVVKRGLLTPLEQLAAHEQALADGVPVDEAQSLSKWAVPELRQLASSRSLAARRLRTMEQLSRLIVQSKDPIRLREQMLLAVVNALGGDHGSLWVLAPEGGFFVGVAETGAARAGAMSSVGVRLTQVSEPLLEALERQGEPVLVMDPGDPAYASLMGEGFIASHEPGPVLGVPLMQLGKMIGCLLVSMNDRGVGFDVADLALARQVAAFAAVALENTRSQEAERARTLRMTALAELATTLTTRHRMRDVLSEIVSRGAALANSATCSVFILDESINSLVLSAQVGLSSSEISISLPLNHPLVQSFLHQGQPLIVEDIDHEMPELRDLLVRADVSSIYVLPLQASGRILGALTLGFLDRRRPDEAELSVSEMLASVSAAAIQNAIAFEGEVEQRNLLATVAEISRRVSAILDTEWMLNEVCRLLAGEFDFEWVHVLLVNEAAGQLGYAAGFGPLGRQLSMDELVLPLDGSSLVGRVVQSSKAERQGAIAADAFQSSERSLHQVESEIGVPIVAHNRVIGVLVVQSSRPHAFGADDERLLGIVTEQIGVALDNARHHAQVQAQARLDSLTQVLNHGAFVTALHAMVDDVKRDKLDLSLIMLDVDHFKAYNDQFGHVAGDVALKTTVQAIKANVKSRDAVGRWGGEEFGVALAGASKSQARMVADRIRQTLSSLEPVDRLGRRMPSPTVSQGIATLGEDASDADQLVDVADQALYRAKEQGRDRVVVTGWQ
jgi:diguanylate cyclase (GGDEF)-like protein